MLVITYGITVGGLLLPIGSPPNLIGRELLEQETGEPITFFGWFVMALPIVIVMVRGCLRRQPDDPGARGDLRRQLRVHAAGLDASKRHFLLLGHAADHADDQGRRRVRHHRSRPMRGGRDRDGEPGGPGLSLLRPAALAIAAGATTVLPGFLVGALALQIKDDLDVGVTAVAAGVTVFFACGAVGAGPGGRLAERVGALRAIRGCVVTTAACLLLAAALVHSLLVLLLLLAVAGVANSVSQPAINLFMADQVPLERQGLAFGIKQSAIPGAVLVSGLALPLLALPFGWRPTFVVCALGALVVATAVGRTAPGFVAPPERPPPPRPSRELVLTAVGAALASAGPNALGAYLVASAVDAGISEGAAGLLAAAGSLSSLAMRVALGVRADRRRDYGFSAVVALLAAGAGGFALLASGAAAPFAVGAVVAFTLGWGWPGLFNLAVVDLHREAPGAATGVSQSGIYLGAAAGPAAYGLLSQEIGYPAAWGATAVLSLVAAAAIGYAARSHARVGV
jgi:predicted MFS family arabinose efflux permease